MKEYKILLVDDHEIIINGIMNALLPLGLILKL